MSESEKINELLGTILAQLPSLLALLGCTVVALFRWRRHPKVSMVLSFGLMFLFAHILIFASAFLWLPEYLIDRGMYEKFSSETIYTVMSLTYNTGLAIGFVLLLTSIFMQRNAQATVTS